MAEIFVDVKIHVNPAAQPFKVDASGVPADAQVGVPYSGALSASGGKPPYNFVLSSGSLPDGLTLGSDGSITGTPSAEGDFDAEIDASDSDGAAAKARVSGSVA